MKKVEALDISVAVLAAISCLFIYIKVPVWAVFIGWAWYFNLGSAPSLIKKGILPMITGSVLAALAFVLINVFTSFMPSMAATMFVLINVFTSFMPSMAATMLSVLITVFLLMMSCKIPCLNISLMSFNAYSCMFIGYSAGSFMVINGMPPLLNAAIWITGANFIGLIFGWLSIKFTKFVRI